jgi:hypothetical protein
MTLVAGFRATDGFVVGADTQIMFGQLQYQDHKLERHYGTGSRFDLILGGAGSTDYIKMTTEHIRDAVTALPQPKLPLIIQEIEKIIEWIHKEHLLKYWSPGDIDRPSVNLIIGIRDEDANFGLLQTADTSVHAIDVCGFVGSGSLIAHYLAQKIIRPGLSTAVVRHLARQVFREVKGKGYAVGGNTEIISSRVTANAEGFFDIPDKDHRFLWGLEAAIYSAVRCSLDRSKSSSLIEHRLAFMKEKLEMLRKNCEHSRRDEGVGAGEQVTDIEYDSEWDNWFEDN